ncbi:MAG: O-antigen ligase family protein [bacterium]
MNSLIKNWHYILGILLGIGMGFITVFLGWWSPALSVALVITVFIFFLSVKKPFTGLILITFLLPFERIGSFDVAGSTIRGSQIIALAVLASFVFYFLLEKRKRLAANPLASWMLLFLGISLLSLITAVNFQRGLMVWFFIAFVFAISWLIPNLINNKKQLKIIIGALLLTTVIVSIFGLYQFLGDVAGLPSSITGLREHYTSEVFGFPRIHSTGLEPLYFANFLLIPIGIILSLWLARLKAKTWWLKSFILLLLLGLAGLNLILTLSRGGYLGLFITVFVIAIILWQKLLHPQVIVLSVGLILVALLAATYFIQLGEQDALSTFTEQATTFTTGSGVVERFDTYEQAWDLFQTKPWLGVGIGNFGPEVATYPDEIPNTGWLIVNNQYLETLAETGIFGLFTFLMIPLILLIRSAKAILKAQDKFIKLVLIGLTAAALGTFFQYLTFSTIYILHIWFLIGLLIACQNLVLIKPHEENN